MPAPSSPATTRRPHAAHYIASCVATVFCVVLLYLAAREARGVLARGTEGVPLVGTVTGRRIVAPSSADRGKRAQPKPGSATIEYTVVASYQGRTVQVVNRFRSALEEHQVGDQVPVVYVPGRPEHSRLATTTEQYGQLLQLAGFGLLSGFAAALLWVRKLTVNALFGRRTAATEPQA